MTKWFFLFLFGANSLVAQDVVINNNMIQIDDEFELGFPLLDQQYISTQWAKAKLFYANGTTKTYDSLNFDRYSNEIEVVLNNKVITLRAMGLVAALIYQSKTSGSLLMVGTIESSSLFLLVKSQGAFLLASYLTTNEIKNKEDNYNVNEVRFVPKSKNEIVVKENYVVRKQNVWSPFKLNKSNILKLFEIDKKTFQSIMENQEITLVSKEEPLQIFKTLNDN